jgi:hypothetical protein
MDAEERDAEGLRRRLYRPGASPADLADYLHVAAADRVTDTAGADTDTDTDTAPPPAGAPLRPFVIGGAVVAAAALLGAVLLTSGRSAPAATPTVAAAASAVPTQPGNGSQVTFTVVDVLDGGEIDHARGAATQDGPEMYRYVVAPGDTASAVADRFGLCAADVIQVLPYGFDPGRLPAGATLELVHYDGDSC